MDAIQLIARILFVYLIIGSAVGHLTQTAAMAGYGESRGLPSAKLAVQISGVALALGGLSVLLGIWGDVGALGLAILLAITAVSMHGFWKESDPQARMNEMTQFSKDLALAGAALMLFAFFSFTGNNLGLTITGPLFHIR